MTDVQDQIDQIKATIASLQGQREILGASTVDIAILSLSQKLATLQQPPAFDPHLGGERKLVTVMFADIAGFTALSEKLDPEQVRSLMNACFDHLVPIINRYDGKIDKFIGDAVMALFGAPIAYENHAERALCAALDLMDAMVVFNNEHQTSLGLHIGINTGLVVAGGIGASGQQQYSVMGDTVNLASRLEDASDIREILVGLNSYRLTARLFDFDICPPIKVKGKDEPVPVYRLLHKSTSSKIRSNTAGLQSPLVGREPEIARLSALLNRLQQGNGCRVALIGEAGQGKSRLLAEIRETSTARAIWVEGRALSYTEGMSYWLARDLLLALIGVKADTPVNELETALRSTVERHFPEDFADTYPFLARFLDLPVESEKFQYLSSEALHRQMLKAYVDYVKARAAEQPLVLICEDIHWADPSSLTVLEALLPLPDEHPVTLILAFRPELGHTWDFHQSLLSKYANNYEIIQLAPLNRENAAALLNGLLVIDNLPEPTRQMILDKAEGNPFFIEELLRSLIDSGLIIMESEHGTATSAIAGLRAIDVPNTLQGVIAARIDRLDADDKRTLQTASVIGRVFHEQVLSYLFESAGIQRPLNSTLGNLRQREFIRLRAELEYIFKHAVTQDVAYGSLLLTKRRDLHRITAEAIEKLFPANLEELSATLAYHYEHAEVKDKAVFYLIKAADRARSTYANSEAIAFCQTAIRLSDPAQPEGMETLAQLNEQLADILQSVGQLDKAREMYTQAVTRIPEAAHIWRSRLHRKIGNTWITNRRPDEALQALSQAEHGLEPVMPADRTTQDLEVWAEWLEIKLSTLWIYYLTNQVLILNEVIEQIRQPIQTYGTAEQRCRFWVGLFQAIVRRDRWSPSGELAYISRQGWEAAQESRQPALLIQALFLMGESERWSGHLDDAEKYLKSGVELTERTGEIGVGIMCMAYLPLVYRNGRRLDEARHAAQQCLSVATTLNTAMYIGAAHGHLAWAAWSEGNATQLQEHGRLAHEYWQRTLPVSYPFRWIAYLPLLAVSLDSLPDAIAYAVAMIEPTQQRLPESLTNALTQASAAWTIHQAGQARQYLEQAVEFAQQLSFL